jgi:hypothetical protein
MQFIQGYCENQQDKDSLEKTARQYGFTRCLEGNDNFIVWDTKIDTELFESVKTAFNVVEEKAIQKEQRKLNKQGYATYSSAFNSAMINKFPNSDHHLLASAKSINTKLKENGKLYI